MTNENNKISTNLIWILPCIIVILTIIFCQKACNQLSDLKGTTPNHDSIYKAELKQDSIINKAKLRDSILVVTKIKYIVRYKTVYDSLYINDTLCQQSLITLYNAFGDLNSANDSLLSNKDTIIKALVNKVAAKQSHITIDSTYIETLKDSIPRVARSEFKRGRKVGAKWGFIGGVVLVEGVNVGAKFVK